MSNHASSIDDESNHGSNKTNENSPTNISFKNPLNGSFKSIQTNCKTNTSTPPMTPSPLSLSESQKSANSNPLRAASNRKTKFYEWCSTQTSIDCDGDQNQNYSPKTPQPYNSPNAYTKILAQNNANGSPVASPSLSSYRSRLNSNILNKKDSNEISKNGNSSPFNSFGRKTTRK